MLKLISVLGTRPQFIKAALLSKKFESCDEIDHVTINTNQHYDDSMSKVFFDELEMAPPKYNLNINKLSHAAMTGKMMIELESIFQIEKLDAVVVYGDCDTTLAGALVASKLHIPVIHIEAGLRSYNQSMPEEINRVLTDHVSNLLFCPTYISVENLKKENITKNVLEVGDLMIELLNIRKPEIELVVESLLNKYSLQKQNYYLLTLHRASNTKPDLVKIILEELSKSEKTILFPIHPRTRKVCADYKISFPKCFKIIEPLSYYEMMALLSQSYEVITDSGGLQKEAYEYGKTCHTLRDETEWLETLKSTNHLISINSNLWKSINNFKPKISDYRYKANTSQLILDTILDYFESKQSANI